MMLSSFNEEPKRQALIDNETELPAPHSNNNENYAPPMSQSVSFDASTEKQSIALTQHEVLQIRRLLNNGMPHNDTRHNAAIGIKPSSSFHSITGADSEYSEFPQTTHAWAVFADHPQRKATFLDRIVGTFVMIFQMFTYYLFASEAIEDYQRGAVPVLVSHDTCQRYNYEPGDEFMCDAEETSHLDAMASFVMLGIFLSSEVLGALRAMRNSYQNINTMGIVSLIFASLAFVEVLSAYLAAAIAISYQLFIGEVTDAIEAGVGLLFVRELSSRAYAGIRHKGVKQYKSFGFTLMVLIVTGFVVEAYCESYAIRLQNGSRER